MYTQRYAGGFVNADGSRQVDATFLNNVESALLSLFGVAPATNGALVWDGTKFTAAALVKNAQVDPAAAIDKTKLGPLGIVDADVSGGAAIDGSKLSNIPPSKIAGYPADPLKVLKGDATWAQPPGTELAYNEFTANVAITAVNPATANTVVTASAVTFDGATAVIIEFHAGRVDGSANAGNQCIFELYDGATDLGIVGVPFINPAATTLSTGAFRASRRLTPSAGAHTFSVRAWASTGTASVSAGIGGAGTFLPGYIRILKV